MRTPGDWTADGDTVKACGGFVVAECCGYRQQPEGDPRHKYGDRADNARFIAAGPKMAAALAEVEQAISYALRQTAGYDPAKLTDAREELTTAAAQVRKTLAEVRN